MVKSEVLISLGDSRLKDVAEVLGNKSAVRILELLGEGSLTVSEVSDELGIKLNTVDYNVKKLAGAGLIERDGFWWSVKGRKMVRWRVSDRRIVISPRRKVAAKFLWVLGLTGIAGLFLRYREEGVRSKGVFMEDAVVEMVPKAGQSGALSGCGLLGCGGVGDVGFWGSLAGWEWFLIGAWVAVVLFFVYSLVAQRQR